KSEFGVLCGDHEVGGQHQLEPTTQCEAVDGGDDRQAPFSAHEAGKAASCGYRTRFSGGHGLEVGARAECDLTLSREENDPHAAIGFHLVECALDLEGG